MRVRSKQIDLQKRGQLSLKATYLNPAKHPGTKFHKVNFVKRGSHRTENILRKYDISTTCINSNNFGRILTNNKEKTSNTKNCVYCTNCKQYNAIYYEETGKNLDIPSLEHFKTINNGKNTRFNTLHRSQSHLFHKQYLTPAPCQ